ncbi:MAG: HTTM domain-containing protein [Verrucomicrobia subdivision 3 bacterium]|nr:HTTM domain-containing protein [Limisphaerales bacterium]
MATGVQLPPPETVAVAHLPRRLDAWQWPFVPVDIASLVVFRVLFGLTMLVEAGRYLGMDFIGEYYVKPKFHFTYYGFDWVKPWPGIGMYVHFAVLGAAALGVLLGFWYRLSATLLFVTFTYAFLLDQAYYLNHFYLVSLLCLLMVVIPAHRAGSLDAWRAKQMNSSTAPRWVLALLLAQLSIVYFYAGIAKLNGDWLRGEPFRSWLAPYAQTPVLGLFVGNEWGVQLFNYGGLIFDLAIVPLLLWKRTRVLAFVWAVTFHLLNAILFSIGIFPWLMIAATTLYLRPDWPRLLWAKVKARFNSSTVQRFNDSTLQPFNPSILQRRVAISLISAYLAIQLLVPLRHLLYPGSVHWTEEGHRFSWHMKLRDKTRRPVSLLPTRAAAAPGKSAHAIT